MKNTVFVILCLAITSFCFTGILPVSIKLPRQSNVYPDTFAIYWQLETPYRHENVPVKFVLQSMFGDPYGEEETYDSIFTIPFFPEYKHEQGFVIQGTAKLAGTPSGRMNKEKSLTIVSKKENIEALIALTRTAPSTFNLRLLAEAYEEEHCFANAYYIYKRIIIMNEREGKILWQKFYDRNYSEFNPTAGVYR